MVSDIAYMTIALIIILYGILICSKKKILISRVYMQSLLVFMLGINLLKSNGEGLLWTISIMVLLFIFSLVYLKGRFEIHNVSNEDMLLIVEKVLTQINIEFQVEGDSIVLSKFDDANIVIEMRELNLRKVMKLDFYSELINGIRVELKTLGKSRFSLLGPFYICLGLILAYYIYTHH